MNTHDNLIQGSAEWLAHRRSHFNASDAPAMMGCSPYKTRTQLLHEMHTGLVPEVDAATQRRFDDGHRFEALARPLAEAIIGEDLFPVVGTEGKLSASFDGLTMGEDTAFEHKTLNAELRTCMRDEGNGYDLPKQYQIQMEQQLMVSGAGRVLFMATKWDGETLSEKRHCWYASDPKLRAEIVQGWAQFETDLAAYVPAETVAPVIAAPVESLPAVSVRMNGSLAVVSNLDLFGTALRRYVDKIDMKPSTDQAFADAEAAVKTLGNAEDALEQAEAAALAQTASVEEMRRTVADYVALARTTRLMLEKVVKARKEQIRVEIVQDGTKALADHVAALNVRLGKPYMPPVTADFAMAIKGKRTIDSLRDAVDTTLAHAKMAASATADRMQVNLTLLRETAKDHAFLFADTAQIVLKANDDFATLVKSRIDAHKAAEAAKEEALREKLRQEALARIEREQAEAARVARVARVKAEAEEQAALELARKQEADSVALAAKASEAGAELSPAAQALNEAEGAARFASVHRSVAAAFAQPTPNVVQMRTAAPVAVPNAPPSVREQLNARLDRLTDADLKRVLSFVQSRYGVEAA